MKTEHTDVAQIDRKVAKRLRWSLLQDQHGTADEQKNALVSEIMATFCDPQKWPMTDAERIAVLREWYRRAYLIRQTETSHP